MTTMSEAPSMFPMMLNLSRRPCLVVGAGAIGEGKIAGLLAAGAAVRVVAPEATPQVLEWARAGRVAHHNRRFTLSDLDEMFVAVAATSDVALNHEIYQEARRRRVLCNVVDDPEYCDFFYPAIVRRGRLQIAISTSGVSPALARRLRELLEKLFGPQYELLMEEAARRRAEILGSVSDPARRRELLEQMAAAIPLPKF